MQTEDKPTLGQALKEPGPILLILAAIAFLAVVPNVLGLLAASGILITAVVVAGVMRNSPLLRAKITKAKLLRAAAEEKWTRTHTIEKLDAQSRVQMKSIIKCLDEITDEVASMGLDGITPEFSSLTLQSEILYNRSLEMAQTRSQLLSHLLKSDKVTTETRIEKLKKDNDARPSEETVKSIKLQEEELVTLNNMQTTADEILQYLESAAITMSSMKSRLLSLKTVDAQAALAAVHEYSKQVTMLSESADELESQSTNLNKLME